MLTELGELSVDKDGMTSVLQLCATRLATLTMVTLIDKSVHHQKAVDDDQKAEDQRRQPHFGCSNYRKFYCTTSFYRLCHL